MLIQYKQIPLIHKIIKKTEDMINGKSPFCKRLFFDSGLELFNSETTEVLNTVLIFPAAGQAGPNVRHSPNTGPAQVFQQRLAVSVKILVVVMCVCIKNHRLNSYTSRDPARKQMKRQKMHRINHIEKIFTAWSLFPIVAVNK